jgi:excinuclease UvrABC nuclease subunit
MIDRLTKEMLAAAEELRFEEAAGIRDRIDEIAALLEKEEE